MEEPHEDHLAAVKHVLRYIVGTRGCRLFYTRNERATKLVGYSDADLVGDIDTCRSTSGIVFFLGGNPISWQSTKQKAVALSSCRAEYMVSACQWIWLAQLLNDMLGVESGALELWVDNQSAIALSKNPIFNDRGNHIAVRYNFIRECVDEGRISIKFIATEKQLVDVLTKVLGRVRFQELRDEIGIHTTGDHAKD
jgi:hypothetical protein